MSTNRRPVRQSVSLPAALASQVRTMAKNRRLSANRMLVELVEKGIAAEAQKQKEFFELAERFRNASDPDEVKRLGDQMGRWSSATDAEDRERGQFPTGRSAASVRENARPFHPIANLNNLRLWIETHPEVPDTDWYKDFGSFKLCGKGPYPKTFLLRGQVATGAEL